VPGVILFTCSSTSPAVNTVRQPWWSFPGSKNDYPMMAKAVETGFAHHGLLCPSKTLGPSEG
jgi:hypothetical protein